MQEKSAISLIEELIFKYATIKEAQDRIDDEKCKYEKAIEEPKLVIENSKKGITALKQTKISVNLETLVEEIAKEWCVPVEDLSIELKTDTFFAEGELCEERIYTRLVEPGMWSEKPEKINLQIETVNDGMVTSLHISNDLTENFFNAQQKDGRTLRECLKPVSKVKDFRSKGSSIYEYGYICEEYQNVNFEFKLCTLVDRNGQLTDMAQIILRAHEIDFEKENNI